MTMQVEIPAKTESGLVQLDPHVTFQWLYDARVFRIAMSSSQRTAVDTYIGANRAVLQNWDNNQRFFSIQDISHPNVSMTPYFREGLESISKTVLELGIHGDSIILLAGNFMGRVVQTYGRIFARNTAPINQHWFTNKDRGITFLESLLKQA